jgi:hypothetical protein
MNEQNDRELRELLKKNFPRVDGELNRDLWPQMLRRIDENSHRVPWFDWALLAFLGTCLLLFPKAIPVLLYHL